MCGRFTLRVSATEVAKAFGLAISDVDLSPRYNVAPTQPVAAVRTAAQGPERQLSWLQWGLVPGWADDPSIGNTLINARAETVASKPAFRDSFRQRRCLVIADGFYEWRKEGRRKQPYHIGGTQPGVLAFAGLWDCWRRGDMPLESCTIITTDANDLVRPLHDRMPAIIAPGDYGIWLDPDAGPDQLSGLLRPFPAERMSITRVSTLVNNTANDVAECLQPADEDEGERQLTFL